MEHAHHTQGARTRARGCVVGLVAVAVLAVAAPAGARQAGVSVPDRVHAGEVCENMVRDAAVAAVGAQLVSDQVGHWQGTRYTCRYDFGPSGVLLARVRVYRDDSGSADAFSARRAKAKHVKELFGLGSAAFRMRDGTLLVARKDNFVLTIDGRGLTRAVGPDGVVFSATRAVFDCW